MTAGVTFFTAFGPRGCGKTTALNYVRSASSQIAEFQSARDLYAFRFPGTKFLIFKDNDLNEISLLFDLFSRHFESFGQFFHIISSLCDYEFILIDDSRGFWSVQKASEPIEDIEMEILDEPTYD